ncbi:MAG: hypothetical protein ACOC1X_02140 [Promethearchaeota archaeon]
MSIFPKNKDKKDLAAEILELKNENQKLKEQRNELLEVIKTLIDDLHILRCTVEEGMSSEEIYQELLYMEEYLEEIIEKVEGS